MKVKELIKQCNRVKHAECENCDNWYKCEKFMDRYNTLPYLYNLFFFVDYLKIKEDEI